MNSFLEYDDSFFSFLKFSAFVESDNQTPNLFFSIFFIIFMCKIIISKLRLQKGNEIIQGL